MKANHIGLSFPRMNQQRKVVFHGLSFVLPNKGLVVITGDSGVGKTSLLSMICGEKKPTTGNIIFPKSWTMKPPVYLADQLTLVSTWHVKDFVYKPETNKFLNQLGLSLHDRKKRFQELSGGQKIRVMIALFFSQSSACYLLDEPTHALDEELRRKMIEFLTNQANHHLIVIATHDLELISEANHELHIRSIYESTWKDKQFNAVSFNNKENSSEKVMKKHWLKKIFWLHRGRWLGSILSIASMMIHVGLLFTGLIQHSFVQQSYRYLQMQRREPFLSIQEVEQTDIHESPFQLIKTQAPDAQQLSLAISMIPNARVMTSIDEWFPRSIEIEDVIFDLRFIDLPYENNQISVMWIYPNIILPTYVELTSIKVVDSIMAFSYGQEIRIIEKRPIQSWFEPPQILFSYWQWLHLLQTNHATMNGEDVSFLDFFKTMYPPSSVLVYDPSGAVKDILLANPSHHAWTIHQALEKTYELKHLLLDSTKTLTQFIFIGLWMLGLFLWSTRLHWIFQNHQNQWRWLLLLHIPMRTLWKTISLRTFLSGFMTLAMVQWMFVFIIIQWRFIPGTTFITMLMISSFIYFIQQISRYFILRWYGHA